MRCIFVNDNGRRCHMPCESEKDWPTCYYHTAPAVRRFPKEDGCLWCKRGAHTGYCPEMPEGTL